MISCIQYYGGKNRLIPELLPLIPPHKQYVEAFCGGASLLFAKPKSDNEVINDRLDLVVNFFKVCKDWFEPLQFMIQRTPHSESEYRKALRIIKNEWEGQEEATREIHRAWAFWAACNMSFGHKPGAGFAFSESGQGKATSNKRDNFTYKYYERLKEVEIFSRDAVDLIELKDSPNTFFYLDPPYVSSEQGHYSGYTMEDFKRLLDTLTNIKGKFLLSSYPEDILMEYRKANNWNSKDMEMVLQVTGKREATKYKTESLSYNYDLQQHRMF